MSEPLTPKEQEIVNAFHELYYERWTSGRGRTLDLQWQGRTVRKCPMDLWVYQEILRETRPDVIIETGTFLGGSALYMANMMDVIGHGKVISIDVSHPSDLPHHPRVHYLTGSSVDPIVVGQVIQHIEGGRAMVMLDSDHSEKHVRHELEIYHSFVSRGDYLIVEDTNINGHPTFRSHGPGPMEALVDFIKSHAEFEVDKSRERFLLTMNPQGYLRRR